MKYLQNLSIKNIGSSWRTTTAGTLTGSAWIGYHIIQSIHLSPTEIASTSFIIIGILKIIVGLAVIGIGLVAQDSGVKQVIVDTTVDKNSQSKTDPK